MKLLFVSLGCDKNLVDSEVMLELLHEAGCEITDDETEAEAVVVNTCCFIHDAKEESIQTILEMAELKKTSRLKTLVVTGCLAERYRKEILEEIPEVDAILGSTAYDQIVEAVSEAEKGRGTEIYQDINYLPKIYGKRMVTTGGYYSYLKIAEGCDKHCTYCIIPSIRGNYRSVPMEKLLFEAKKLVDNGVRELILVAQETTLYGKDIYGKKKLPELLRQLCAIPQLHWVRLLYCYPEEITEELIEVMQQEKKICHYIDMPIQHASDTILKRMGRRTTKQEILDMIAKLRGKIPDIAIRTSLISGFPGETEEEHRELVDFVDMVGFERLGVFTYSAEEDTPAASMENQIPEEVKQTRRDEIMQLQREVALENGEDLLGNVMEAMIEGKLPEEHVYIGRTYMDAPNVDGYIFVNSEQEFLSGDFVKIRITKVQEYDLFGEIAE